jgi:hypothetical protein
MSEHGAGYMNIAEDFGFRKVFEGKQTAYTYSELYSHVLDRGNGIASL